MNNINCKFIISIANKARDVFQSLEVSCDRLSVAYKGLLNSLYVIRNTQDSLSDYLNKQKHYSPKKAA